MIFLNSDTSDGVLMHYMGTGRKPKRPESEIYAQRHKSKLSLKKEE